MKICKQQWDGFWSALQKASEGFYYDDSDIDPSIDDADTNPGEVFSVSCGTIHFGEALSQRDTKPFEVPGIFTRAQVRAAISDSTSYGLVAAIGRYLKSLETETIAVQIPKAATEELTALVNRVGGTILRGTK